MASKLPCYGGPLDGTPATPMGGTYRYIDADGGAHREPGPGRVMYVREGTCWRYPRAGTWVCPGCGGVVAPDARGRCRRTCPLCGARQSR